MTRMAKRASSPRRASRARAKRPAPSLARIQASWPLGALCLLLALLTLVGLFSREHGTFTALWLGALRHAFGWGIYVVPPVLAFLGVWVLIHVARKTPTGASLAALPWPRIWGALILFVSSLALSQHLMAQPQQALLAGRGGGALGYWVDRGLVLALGWLGATVFLGLLLILSLTLLLQIPLDQAIVEGIADTVRIARRILGWMLPGIRRLGERFARPRAHRVVLSPWQPLEEPSQKENLRTSTPSNPAPVAPSVVSPQPEEMPISEEVLGPSLGHRWLLPRIEEILAESSEVQISLSDIREKTRIIEETLNSLGVPAAVVEVNPGPVVTQFGLEPGYIERRDREGRIKRVKVKVSRIQALANDLALALAASHIRIEAPVPGKGIVGLEVPNSEITIVGLRGVIESDEFREIQGARLAVCLGRDVSGGATVEDLAKLPHLLIAGATGSGKSVCINALIACLLCRNTPEDLRLLMIDPKRVELSAYNGIPHLLAPVVVDAERVVSVLRWLTHEMDRRYKVFAKVGARNIQSYNAMATARAERHMPYIVVFIDELADLMMVSADEVERAICRLAQLARATGIHLVIATQRPSVDVVTGLIKANFPARLSFAVSSQVDARVILDVPGAEKLLGRGDALYMAPDSPLLARIQGCYVSDEELARLVAFWRGQVARQAAMLHPAQRPTEGQTNAQVVQQPLWPEAEPRDEEEERDPLLQEAIALVARERRASASFLQQRLRIGYTRASRLLDLLEERGIVGPASGPNKTRRVNLKAAGEAYSPKTR